MSAFRPKIRENRSAIIAGLMALPVAETPATFRKG